MTRAGMTPSPRLLRAVAAERADLQRRRDGLVQRRDRARAELAEIDAAVSEMDERLALIDRLAGQGSRPEHSRWDAKSRDLPSGEERSPAPSPRTTPAHMNAQSRPGSSARAVLRGPAIRAAAVRILRALPEQPQALHYRRWFALLTASGYSVAGKDPLAVFLTQLSRSPVVRRGTQSGTYELDLDAPLRLRHRLEELQTQLLELAAPLSTATADLGAIRGRRTALNLEITKVEKALEEAEATLREPPAAPGLAAAG